MINLMEKYTREELLELFKSFTKKSDIHNYFGISDNTNGIKYINSVAEEIGFDFGYYKKSTEGICLNCGKKFKKEYPSQKFCSHSCSASYNNSRREVKKDKKVVKEIEIKEKPVKFCLYCGKEIKGFGEKYCSSKCANKHNHEVKYKYFLEHPDEFCRGNYTPKKNIREHILQEQNGTCSICGCKPIHNNKELVFVLDHIDGDASNNRRENLRLICPNCDSQLDTFKSKNKNSKRRNYWKEHLLNSLKKNSGTHRQYMK